MRFGLFMPQGWRLDLVGIPVEQHWPVMRDLALHADARPWDSLWVHDHFHTVPMPTAEATHEAWTLMAATTDIISGGRVQMGIGGGWYEHEWPPTDTASRRRGSGWPDSTRACR